MQKPTIAVDVDDVLALSAARFIAYNNKLWRGNANMENYTEDWIKLWQITPQHLEDWQKNIMQNREIYPDLKPVKNAKTILKKLSVNYEIIVLTSRSMQFAAMTEEWLGKHFADIVQEVHFSGCWDNVTIDSANGTKGKIVRALGAEYLIDDQPKHCLSARENGVKSILFGDYSWNRHLEKTADIHKARNWDEVHKLLKLNNSPQN
jgi:5'(3')-deoxyribonucleotidase